MCIILNPLVHRTVHDSTVLQMQRCEVVVKSSAAVQLQRRDVSHRFSLAKKRLKITRCQLHSRSIPGTHFAIN